MIQRIQTAWLFILAVFCAIWISHFSADIPLVTYILKIGSGIIGVASLIAIFLFKKRKTQLKICCGIFVLLIIICTTLFVRQFYFDGVLYTCGLLIIILAIQAIRKDEKLVRSLDRLR